jgi:hypothetical protein
MTETTSKDVASMAARIVGMSDALIRGLALRDPGAIRSVAASALTQTADKAVLRELKSDDPANPVLWAGLIDASPAKPKRTRKAKVAP